MTPTSITLYSQKWIINSSTELIVIDRSICIGVGFGGGNSSTTFCLSSEGHSHSCWSDVQVHGLIAELQDGFLFTLPKYDIPHIEVSPKPEVEVIARERSGHDTPSVFED